MGDLELYEELVRLSRGGEPFAMATIIASQGSSPRKPGARMLVRGDGSTLGSIGGGRVEQLVMEAACAAIGDGEDTARTMEFSLNGENGYVCGGSMTVYLEARIALPQLVMFGAGHVGRAVAALAGNCGFRVTVVDDRAACISNESFPGAGRLLCLSVADAFRELAINCATFVVIATPDHGGDFAAVRGCLATEAGFIGLLGSRRKRETLLGMLAEEGVDEQQRGRVVVPVGLDIGAETPEELAVSIVGQLIARRRGR